MRMCLQVLIVKHRLSGLCMTASFNQMQSFLNKIKSITDSKIKLFFFFPMLLQLKNEIRKIKYKKKTQENRSYYA